MKRDSLCFEVGATRLLYPVSDDRHVDGQELVHLRQFLLQPGQLHRLGLRQPLSEIEANDQTWSQKRSRRVIILHLFNNNYSNVMDYIVDGSKNENRE